MLAFANKVSEKIIRHEDKEMLYQCFYGIQREVPVCHQCNFNHHYHSITGQKLLHADWERTHGMQLPCPDLECEGTLKTDCSNCLKNKTLFLIYSLDGAPTWCMVMVLVCPCCHCCFKSNEANVLVNLLEDVCIYNNGIFEVSTSRSTTTSSK